MLLGVQGRVLSLDLQLDNRETNKYPQIKIYKPDNTLLATLDLSHVFQGFYTVDYTINAVGYYKAKAIVYTDVGHLILDNYYGDIMETVVIEKYDSETLYNLITSLDTHYSGYGL